MYIYIYPALCIARCMMVEYNIRLEGSGRNRSAEPGS